jgi:hypothetical protein
VGNIGKIWNQILIIPAACRWYWFCSVSKFYLLHTFLYFSFRSSSYSRQYHWFTYNLRGSRLGLREGISFIDVRLKIIPFCKWRSDGGKFYAHKIPYPCRRERIQLWYIAFRTWISIVNWILYYNFKRRLHKYYWK